MKCLGVFLAAYGTSFTLASPESEHSEELGVSPLQLLQSKLLGIPSASLGGWKWRYDICNVYTFRWGYKPTYT